MERNIAALMREDCRTVRVVFWQQNGAGNEYTYLTYFPVEVDDLVVVYVEGRYKTVRVVSVDDDVQIEPNDPTKYTWLISKVDLAASKANDERNEAIEAIVHEAYKANLRHGFAQTVLASVTQEKRLQIENLLKPAS